MRRIFKTICRICLILGFTIPFCTAYADSFQGTQWKLSYSGIALPDNDNAHQSFLMTLGVDTSGYSGNASFLDQLAFKVSNAVSAFSLVNAPSGTSAWAANSGGLSASGCNGSGSGFICLNSLASLNNGKGLTLMPGNDYSWVFRVTVNNGALLTDTGGASLKARFVNAAGGKSGALLSEPITITASVPEPGAGISMLLGLGIIGTLARRRRNTTGV